MLKTNPLMKFVIKDIIYLVLAIFLLRLSSGAFVFAIVLSGVTFSLRKRGGAAVGCLLSLFFLQNINFAILPATVFLNIGCKAGIGLIGMSMLMANAPKSRLRLPLGGLVVYMIWMCVSSMQGYFPLISYLKIVNFAFFLLAVCLSVRYLQFSELDALRVRAMFLAMAFIMVFGSLMTLPFPSIAYSRQLAKAALYGIDMTGEMLLESTEMSLFNGLAWHSQALAPMVAITVLYVGCDMLFIEKRFAFFHVMIIAVAPLIMFMTRSRTALSTVGGGGLVLVAYALRNAVIPRSIKSKVRSLMAAFIVLGMAGMIVSQFCDQRFEKWLRKTDDVLGDRRTLSEAITSTRMGSIEMNIADFMKSPMVGTGFQVLYSFPELYENVPITSLLSAPCEKGVTPLVVFAEGGVIGGLIFHIFIIVFYAYCVRRKLVSLVTLFTALLISNLSESTFFSPSGAGGYMWSFAMLGGITLDYIVSSIQNTAEARYIIDERFTYRMG